MSADNGIYILETLGKKDGEFEYRIAELQAVENYEWHWCSKHGDNYQYGHDGKENCSECRTGYCDHVECHIKHARKMWGRSQVYHIKSIALITAGKMLEDCLNDEFGICEYGIQFIKINAKF